MSSNLPPGVTDADIEEAAGDDTTEHVDAWCEECGEYRMIEAYTATYNEDTPPTIVEGFEVCIMCGGKMTLDEPKITDLKRIE